MLPSSDILVPLCRGSQWLRPRALTQAVIHCRSRQRSRQRLDKGLVGLPFCITALRCAPICGRVCQVGKGAGSAHCRLQAAAVGMAASNSGLLTSVQLA